MRLVLVLSILLAVSVPFGMSSAEPGRFAIRGIALGMSQADARARLFDDTPHHETTRQDAVTKLEVDVGSTLWNLAACRATRTAITRDACRRMEVRYSHPDLGGQMMAVSLTQTLNPSVPEARLRETLVASYGEPEREETSYSGLIWKTATHRTLTWTDDASSLRATFYFYKGEAARYVSLTLAARHAALVEATRDHLAAQGGQGSDADDQLRF